MTPSVLAAPPKWLSSPSLVAERRLDQAIDSLWQQLMGHGSTACPVCGGEMRPEYGPGTRPVGGRCGSCRSRLT